MKYLLAMITLCLSQFAAAGSVYKCSTPQGVVYQESPCKDIKTQKSTCSGYTGAVNFSKQDGDCETITRKEGEKKENEKKEKALKRRDAFIKATMPKTYTASFEDCTANIDSIGDMTDGRIISIVDTDILKMTKFCSKYGSSIVTCSRPDRKMIIKMAENNGCT